MSSRRQRLTPEEEYAQTYWRWRRAVARRRAEGYSRPTPGAEYEKTYLAWREAVRERRLQKRPDHQPDFVAALPWKMRLKHRYRRHRWLLFTDGFAAFAGVTMLLAFGVRFAAPQSWGYVVHSMTEAIGDEQVEEIYRRKAKEDEEVAQRRIDVLKGLQPRPAFEAGQEVETPQERIERLKFVPKPPVTLPSENR